MWGNASNVGGVFHNHGGEEYFLKVDRLAYLWNTIGRSIERLSSILREHSLLRKRLLDACVLKDMTSKPYIFMC
jgi:hypothetical protein